MTLDKAATRFGNAIAPRPAAIAGAVMLALMALALPVLAADPPVPSYFKSVEMRSSNLKPFKKWNSALARYSKESAVRKKGKCLSKNLDICDYDDWIKFLDTLKGKDKLTQIRAVNQRFNQAKYITDKSNWGQNDLWNSPAEFMQNFGDCEDYAIIKYLSLQYLGFPEDDLRVVAVKDLNLKVGHAILVVFWVDPRSGNKRALVLDNQIKKVVDARAVRHYQPVFSINKEYWWRHQSG
jgi:predicted transglutaminase-like cysteine proteinase